MQRHQPRRSGPIPPQVDVHYNLTPYILLYNKTGGFVYIPFGYVSKWAIIRHMTGDVSGSLI